MNERRKFSVLACCARVGSIILVVVAVLSMGGKVWAKSAQASDVSPTALTGTIAYITGNGTEVRAIEADGSNDRKLWHVPNDGTDMISGLAWNPNSTGLAFTSDYEQECSLRQSEVYTLYPDGTHLKRITNAPKCDELSSFAKGSVTVNVQNTLIDVSIVFVYVQGAPEAKTVVLPAGQSRKITIPDVADLGDGVEQFAVVSAGNYRWINPLARADVKPGDTVDAGSIQLTNANKFENWGAYSPSWRRDAGHIGFTVGSLGMYEISPTPANGVWGDPLPMGDGAFASAMAFSPVKDEVLYVNSTQIVLGVPGDNPQSTPLVNYDGVFGGMDWLPDGSGFVFAEYNTFLGNGNMWLYKFAGKQLTPLTELASGFAFDPSVSPDGQSIVYVYAATTESVTELRIRSLDGNTDEALGVSGTLPDWGVTAQSPDPDQDPDPNPGQNDERIFLPNLVR